MIFLGNVVQGKVVLNNRKIIWQGYDIWFRDDLIVVQSEQSPNDEGKQTYDLYSDFIGKYFNCKLYTSRILAHIREKM